MIESFEIPDSWLQTNLGEIINYGKTEKAEPTEIPSDAWVLELEDIEKDSSKLLQRLTFAQRQSKSTKNRFRTGDVLYGKLRPYLNKILIADCDGYCSTEILPLRANQAINGRFLFYWLKHPAFLNYVEAVSHGLNMPRLGTESGKQAPLVLAPLNEQKRIADKLDRLLAKVDACRERCDRIPLILKRFRQSVLAAATSGELTEDWRIEHSDAKTEDELISFGFTDTYCFGDYKFPENWKTCRLEEIAAITGGITKDSKKQNQEDEELPYLRVANVQRGFLDLSEIKTIRVPLRRVEGLLLEPGDILFNEGGDIDKLGRGWIWNGEIERCTFQNHVFRVRLKNVNFEPKFFSWYGNSRGFDYFLSFGKQTTNLASINKSVLSNLPVVVPSAQEQQEIVRRVEKLFAFADRLESRHITARAKCDQLTPALLEKAFQGELVPQDPNDEPASVLLERIKSLRSNAETKQTKPQRRKTASEKSYRSEVKMLTRKEIQPSHLSDILKASGSLTAEALWTASKLEIDDFYDQLKDEEAQNLLKETRAENSNEFCLLEAA